MRKYASLEPGGRGGKVKLTRISPGVEIGAARTGRHLLDRQFAAALRALNGDDCAGRDHGGHAVTGGRAVAEIAAGGRAALYLLGADQVDGLQHAGPDLAELRMLGQRHAGHRGADAETAIGGLLDRVHFVDLLDVDDQARPHRAGTHLHQQVGAPGHNACRTACGRECANRFIKRVRRHVSDIGHD